MVERKMRKELQVKSYSGFFGHFAKKSRPKKFKPKKIQANFRKTQVNN